MDAKIKELLTRLSFFAEDGMADKPIVEIAKQADALLLEVARKPNTQQPVAWQYRAKILGGTVYSDWHHCAQKLHDHYKSEPTNQHMTFEVRELFAAPTVPRDVLMAFGEAVRDAAKRADFDIGEDVDIAAIADRYASKVQPVAITDDAILAIGKPYCKDVCHIPVYSFNEREFLAIARRIAAAAQPEPVNQQLLVALKRCQEQLRKLSFKDSGISYALESAHAAIAAAEAAQLVGVQQSDLELLAEFDSDKASQPASAQPVAVPDAMQLAGLHPTQYSMGYETGWNACRAVMLSAAQKQEGV